MLIIQVVPQVSSLLFPLLLFGATPAYTGVGDLLWVGVTCSQLYDIPTTK